MFIVRIRQNEIYSPQFNSDFLPILFAISKFKDSPRFEGLFSKVH